ncbi:hypothetical protein N7448_004886 [Penicillium atrosanguineum]|uniref:CST complex subunit Stn1 N-terminal domain-containing protein n=1 Tax=Penicillium atrosanguineum TaxID=1132637 RepID=A0A9W9H2D7_9EURO|nr:uncharacterized protein N7443_008634 [Penicillium atrosanguineum]KAJ5125566.1 hypothetical protein N7526_007743 [Penicillium atrosanguineum]KAJ5136332.1 hypothetical protein N7448_004886 [Penicillium atrosanguineum]KAJ5292681.1 hypothetical protein N7443_008634 [Penicillium atrosanguineum]KAJ5303294.1 hypothetical protein N7476_010093 [Penicillium atrosanguineum]
MEAEDDAESVFYPAFCFKASPTHFAWVKMAASDVHRLKRPEGFGGQTIFFYQNHPIRFVCIAGVIVARNEITRRTILTLDDSSGTTLEVVILHADPNVSAKNESVQASESGVHADEPALDTSERPPGLQSNQTVHVSATDRTPLDISSLVPGTMVKLKGTLSIYRQTMQLQLERFVLVSDTNAEMQFVDERVRFLVDVLSVPWMLLEEEIEQLRLEAEQGDIKAIEERKRVARRNKRRMEREARDQRHIQKRYEKEEKIRAKEAFVCKEDGERVMQDIRQKREYSEI